MNFRIRTNIYPSKPKPPDDLIAAFAAAANDARAETRQRFYRSVYGPPPGGWPPVLTCPPPATVYVCEDNDEYSRDQCAFVVESVLGRCDLGAPRCARPTTPCVMEGNR